MNDKTTMPQKPVKRWRIKRTMSILLALIVIAVGLWFFGPREPVDTAISFDADRIGSDLDAYLAQSEAAFDDIEPGTQKKIVWAFPNSKAKTPFALVYLHGFSASAGETRPLSDLAAADLQSNLFYTRLAGHGRGGAAMAEPTVNDWMNDTAEAVAIANRLGNKTILIAVSTGGTLAALAALHPDLMNQIDGIVFIAPNFKLAASTAEVLTMPFARNIVPQIVGKERGFVPQNELHAKFWTERYPSTALLPMAAAVKHARSQFYHNTQIPALFIFSDNDAVVDHTATRAIIEKWGGATQIVNVDDSDDPNHHVIAGDALSPSTTQRLARDIATWARAL